jgi:hypothetical protein
MGLPKIDLPLFDIEIPSTGKRVKYRPFTVKEEKILLIAQESKDIDQIILAIKQIINNCVISVDVNKLAMFDLEYMLINIRAQSVNNEIQFSINDPDTKERIDLTVDISEIRVIHKEDHKQLIKVNDDVHIKMRYPTINELSGIIKSIKSKDKFEDLFNIMISCIENVIEGDSVLVLKDFSDEEVAEFVNSFTTNQIDQIKNFFETMPALRYEAKYKNSNGDDKTFIIEGMETFFI